jgi:ribosomal protein S18 acetylase RimI-like enzyme
MVTVGRLDAATAAASVPRLAEILVACVDTGASVSFLPPMAIQSAIDFYRAIAADVAGGQKILLAGWIDGVLAGTVTLSFATQQNQPHRADVQKLLVHPAARRAGLGRALMQCVEREAIGAGRSLLTLDTNQGEAGEALYRSLGWAEAGTIPGYSLNADRVPWPTVIFWKQLKT